MLAHGRDDDIRREAIEHDDRRAREQRRQQRAVDAVRMGERQHREHAIVGHERHDGAHPRRVAGGDGVVREHGTLGTARAARRVQDERWRVHVLHGRHVGFVLGHRLDDATRVEVGDDARALVLGELRIDRRDGDAALERSVERDGERDAVGEGESDAVAGRDAARVEPSREAARPTFELPVGEPRIARDERDAVRRAPRGGVELEREVTGQRPSDPSASTRRAARGAAACSRPARASPSRRHPTWPTARRSATTGRGRSRARSR